MATQNVNFEIDDRMALTLVAFDQVGNAVSVVSLTKLFNEAVGPRKRNLLDATTRRFNVELYTALGVEPRPEDTNPVIYASNSMERKIVKLPTV